MQCPAAFSFALCLRSIEQRSASPYVRFEAHYGLKSDIAPCPKSADSVAKLLKCRATNFPRRNKRQLPIDAPSTAPTNPLVGPSPIPQPPRLIIPPFTHRP